MFGLILVAVLIGSLWLLKAIEHVLKLWTGRLDVVWRPIMSWLNRVRVRVPFNLSVRLKMQSL